MIYQSPMLSRHLRRRVADIYNPMNMGFIKAMASNTSSLDGLDVHGATIDELAAIKNRDIYDLIKQAMGARSQPLLFTITTCGFIRGGIYDAQYLYLLDAPKTLIISNADASNGRKDIVVLRLDLTTRTITVLVVEGTPSATPAAPAITRTADVYDLELAEISIPAGTSAITQTLITDKRLDDNVCGITVSTVQHIPTASFLAQMLAEFNAWFLTVKGKLSEDAAGNLLQMIQALSYTIEFEAGDWTVGDSECTITIPAITHGMAGDVVNCRAFALVSGVYEASVWAAFETYATIDAGNDITLHYPGSSGYAGRAVLSAYEADLLA